jgi:hypothetical protein
MLFDKKIGVTLHYTLPENPPFQWCSLLLEDVEIMISLKAAAQNWYSNNVSISKMPSNIIIYIYVHPSLIYIMKLEKKLKLSLN